MPTTEVENQAEGSSLEFSSFGDDEWKRQTAADENEIGRLLNDPQQSNLNFDDITFDQSGKADDAEDFEDISDDDLPDEEDAANGASLEVPGLTDDGGTSHDTDDLFGEGRDSSPIDGILPDIQTSPHALGVTGEEDATSLAAIDDAPDFRDVNFDPEPDFFGGANQDPDIPAPAENMEDFLKQTWPTWKEHAILNWNDLLPPKKATYIPKKAGRAPKPLLATKLSLDFDADQEKIFRIPGPAVSSRQQKIRDAENKGLQSLLAPETREEVEADELVMDPDEDSEPVGGFTLKDLEILCLDFDSIIDPPTPPPVVQEEPEPKVADMDRDADWDEMFLDEPAPKRRKITFEPGLPRIAQYQLPSLDRFEDTTARIAKRVRLDMSDPYLLIDDLDSDRAAKRPKLQHKMKRMANGNLGRDIFSRFNISNDEAYDALKENNAKKVRATLGNLSVEHAIPALKLLWPYYKTSFKWTRDVPFHRPQLQIRALLNANIKFSRQHLVKKKHLKGRKVQEIFKESKDLTLNDNSTAVLFEYSEEFPMVLSNFGMGNRVINYYRKKDEADEEKRDKMPIGEISMLQPEDRSPFSIFGTVEAGETVPTLHNQMYRAPIFKHSPRPTDFIAGRYSNGETGFHFYVRSIDHLYVVGQNFPSVDVPGPHARKVTNITKNRLKMVSYRLMRKNPQHFVQLKEVSKHVPEVAEGQNRQKLKEFLHFHKDQKEWGLRPGEVLMEESSIMSMIKPEDTCLLEGTHFGAQTLQDAGFDIKNAKYDAEDDDEKAGKGDDDKGDKMAPWRTSKAFIDACAGKAMLQLHGEGDPTGHGLGFSFIKTSMKGGYIGSVQGPLATSADAIERERKANGGHSYNVKKQEQMYNTAIQEIWGKQKETLSDETEHDDADVLPREDEDDRFNVQRDAAVSGIMDDNQSQLSRMSAASRRKKIKITRQYRNAAGQVETRTEVVDDPVVLRRYVKSRAELDAQARDLYTIKPTGDAEMDRQEQARIEKELLRLERNKERRHAREKQKSMEQQKKAAHAGSPSAVASVEDKGQTKRKCANCGQAGHIKTNRKLCPKLNGSENADKSAEDHGGFGKYSAPLINDQLNGGI